MSKFLTNFITPVIAGAAMLGVLSIAGQLTEIKKDKWFEPNYLTPTVELVTADGAKFCSGVVTNVGILTAGHCTAEPDGKPGKDFIIRTIDGVMFNVELVSTSFSWVEKSNDFSILKFKEGFEELYRDSGYKKVPLSCAYPKMGDKVTSYSNPGMLSFQTQFGWVTKVDYLLESDLAWVIDGFITNTAIMPGSSGGPLYNSEGEVIGLTVGAFFGSPFDQTTWGYPNTLVTSSRSICDSLKTGAA